jgi:Holliday junction resolvasome RuvABC ATP-dependent DNA helicase subunit
MNTWTDLDAPRAFSEAIGWAAIESRFRNWEKSATPTPIFISGDPATGKTTLARIIMRELHIDEPIVCYGADFREDRLLQEKIYDSLRSKSVLQQLTMRAHRFSTGIIIEEVHDMEPKDFKFLVVFLKDLFAKGLREPLIVTCRGELDPKFRKEGGLAIHLDTIQQRDILASYRRLKQLHRLQVADDLLQYLSHRAQRDFFQAIMLLETAANISLDSNKSRIDREDADEALSVLNAKKSDVGLSELVKQVLFSSEASFDDVYRMAETECVFLPQVIHENFIQVLDKNVAASTEAKIDILADYYDCLLTSQVFHEKSFGHWHLLDYVAVFGAVGPHVLLMNAAVRNKPAPRNDTSSTLSHYGHKGANIKALTHVILVTGWNTNTIMAYAHLLWNTLIVSAAKFEEAIRYITDLYPELTQQDIERIMRQPIFLQKKYNNKMDIEWSDYDKSARAIVARFAKAEMAEAEPYQA